MLTEEQKEDICASVEMYLERADEQYGVNIPRPKVVFDTKGTVAGWACWFDRKLNFNPILCAENFEDFLFQIVPHEVAHWIEDAMIFHHKKWQRLYSGRRRQVHGRQWKSVMRTLGAEPKRCHSYSVATVLARKRKRVKLWEARCGCRTHHLSTARKNKDAQCRAAYGTPRYRCTKCKEHVVFTGWLALPEMEDL